MIDPPKQKTSFSRLTGITTVALCALLGSADVYAADLEFTIDASASTPISPYIYGINNFNNDNFSAPYSGKRFGGNRWTGYNWETNASNAGADFNNFSDYLLVGFQNNTPPGEAVRPELNSAAAAGRSVNITVPIAGYVSADSNGEVFASQAAPSSRWHELRAKKSSVYPGQSLSLNPDESDGFVFTDEYVNWVENERQNNQTVLYTLDNEPALWDSTHSRLFGSAKPTFTDVGDRILDHASAIKDVKSDAVVMGPALFGWGAFKNLDQAPDYDTQVPQPRNPQHLDFNRWLLETVAAEEAQQGRTLLDAIDLHWYSEARGNGTRITFGGALNNSQAMVEARVQAPRSLWDPTYVEDSWITMYSTNGAGIQLLRRTQSDIDELKPGTKISISEYNHGGGNHISGGIAQADTLGIFGREGVFNASWWGIEGNGNRAYIEGAFEMFLDFDGQGSSFGDVSLDAETDDDAASSVYASLADDGSGDMILVVINKTNSSQETLISLSGAANYTVADVYQLTSSNSNPQSAGQVPINGGSLTYDMPAYSVSTLRLTAAGLLGDFNGDGTVDAADYTVWRDTRFSTTDLRADANGNGFIDANDYTFWAGNYGASLASAQSAPGTQQRLACVCGFLRRGNGQAKQDLTRANEWFPENTLRAAKKSCSRLTRRC